MRRFSSSARVRRGDWARWVVGAVVLVMAGWGVVAILHPFGLGLPSAAGPVPAAVPITSAPVPSASVSVEAFPARVTWSGHTADRVAIATDPDCQAGPGVPAAFVEVVLDAGECVGIRVAEYLDAAAHARMVIAMVAMSDPATTLLIPMRLTETLTGPSLLIPPKAQTIFAGGAACSRTVGLIGSAATTAGATPNYQALAVETSDLMRQISLPGCGDFGRVPQ